MGVLSPHLRVAPSGDLQITYQDQDQDVAVKVRCFPLE